MNKIPLSAVDIGSVFLFLRYGYLPRRFLVYLFPQFSEKVASCEKARKTLHLRKETQAAGRTQAACAARRSLGAWGDLQMTARPSPNANPIL